MRVEPADRESELSAAPKQGQARDIRASVTRAARLRRFALENRVGVVARVLALIGTTLLLVAGIEVYNGLNLHATREGELRGEAMQLAGIAALEMKTILEGARQLLATLAKLPTAGRWDAHACSLVEATVNSDFEYDFISAVDSDGRLLCSTDRPAGEL